MATALFATAEAQTLRLNPDRRQPSPARNAAMAPARVASLDGTTAWGYGPTSGWGGVGVGSTGIVFDVAIFVPGDGVLKGSTVRGVNIPVLDIGMKNVTAWVRSSLTGKNLAEATASGPFILDKYTSVALDNPVATPEGGLYVGYTFTCSETYPVAIGGDMIAHGLYLRFGGGEWGDYSNQFPPSPLQVLISGFSLPDYDVEVASVGTSVQLSGQEYTLPVTVVSNSGKAISSLDLDVTVDNRTESRHIDFASPLAAGFNVQGSFQVKGTSPAKAAAFDAVMKVRKVNGETYAAESTGTGTVKNLTKSVGRRTVIEEFTGTGCGWCPRGWAGMEYMKANYPERFIGIAFHKYNSTDPMYYANYPMLGLSGAPGCIVDRKETVDPYYGTGQNALGIATDFARLNAEMPEVEVTAIARWTDDEETAVQIEAEVEFLTSPCNYSLVYVLTADSLRGTTTSWRQSNYYASNYTKAQLAGSPLLEEFGKGGNYGSSQVYLTFNDVVVGSSYDTNGNNLGPQWKKTDGYAAGDLRSASYNVSLPTKATLKAALRKDLLTPVVLVVDRETGFVLNAAKTRIGTANAVRDILPASTQSLSGRYNLSGQSIAAPQRGVNLLRMSDGTVRKVLVR